VALAVLDSTVRLGMVRTLQVVSFAGLDSRVGLLGVVVEHFEAVFRPQLLPKRRQFPPV